MRQSQYVTSCNCVVRELTLNKTCRNCEKSRRQCAGYQPTTIQRPHQVPQNLPMEHPFYQYQTPSGVSPGMHAQTPPSSLQHSQGGISSAFSEAQQQNTLGVAPPTTYNITHAEHEWPYQSEYIFDDTARWSPGQGSWVSASMPVSQPYAYGMHATAYSPYPGRPHPSLIA